MEDPIITKLEIYDTYEIASRDTSVVSEAISYAIKNPRVFDYRGSTFAVRKTTDSPHCRVVQGPVAVDDARPTVTSALPEGKGSLGLLLPDVMGSAEYAAIYELIEDTTATEEEALAVCREIKGHADAIIKRLEHRINVRP